MSCHNCGGAAGVTRPRWCLRNCHQGSLERRIPGCEASPTGSPRTRCDGAIKPEVPLQSIETKYQQTLLMEGLDISRCGPMAQSAVIAP
jgi:hypothetical protein